MIATRLAELRVATMLLTRLPVGSVGAPVPAPGAAGWAFPLVGALVGVAGWSAYAVSAGLGLPPGIAAVIAVAATILLTGGLHEDGLADFADGVGGGRDRKASLAIMRDSRVGTFGVLALIVALALKMLAIVEVSVEGRLLAAFVAVGAGSRGLMLCAMAFMPPAREDGLGRSAGRVDAGRLAAGLMIAAALLLPLGQAALAVAAVMAIAAGATAVAAERRLGGQTGDVLGAIQCAAEIAGWLALVAAVSA